MRRYGACLLCWLSIALVYGRSWNPQKSFWTISNPIPNFDSQSATFTYIRLIDDGLSKKELDASDLTFKIDFGKPIGTPVTVSCSQGFCVNWMQQNKIAAQLVKSEADTSSLWQAGPSKTWSEITVKGPSHSYTFNHKGEQLFGGPVEDLYPSNLDVKENAPYTTSEGGHHFKNTADAVVERVWYTSGGRGIRVSEETPLFIDSNDERLVLSAKNELPYPTSNPLVTSKITMVVEENVKKAWIAMNANLRKVSPPEISVRKAMISTWVAFKRDITQQKVIDFAKTIKSKQLDIGIIGVDDGWETCYGSQIFDKTKFPDPKAMVDELHQMGHTVTLWVHPFVNLECEAHDRLKDYLVKYDDGTILTSTWWNGQGGMINFLNESAVEFYTKRLRKLQEDYDLDGFKFDAGEVSYIYGLNQNFTLAYPNSWTRSYVEMAAQFGPLGEVRVGAGTPDANIRQRLQDLNSVWSVEGHGLAAVIPAMLGLTVAGYGATIPDMIGGNAYNEEVGKELYVRWMQLNTFLPVMQFSILPWSFDDETLKLTQNSIALHEEYSPYMMDLFYDTGLLPVVSPLWMIEPNTKEALTCNDEFLVGDQILVAPVVKQGAVTRDVYFPAGVWKDMETGTVYEGPKTVKDFPAPLTKLPWFVRQRFATTP